MVGLRWWDRNRTEGNMRNYLGPTNKNMNGDIIEFPKTIYERVPEYSSTLQCYMNRGVTSNIQLKWMVVVTKYSQFIPLGPLRYLIRNIPFFGKYLLPNELIGEGEVVDSAISDLENYSPRVQWLTLATPDGYRHSFGSDREEYYKEILQNIDKQIAKYRNKCKEIGGEELNRLFVITSDHGVVNLEQHVNIEQILGQVNVKMYYGNSAFVFQSELDEPIEKFDEYDGVVAVNGNTAVHVYFRDPIDRNSPENNYGWKTQKDCFALQNYQKEDESNPVDIIDILRLSDGVELVICLQDFEPLITPRKEVHIYSKLGHSFIYQNEENYLTYEVDNDEEDALGWFPKGSSFSHSNDDWLDLTVDWEFPYATVRLWRAMNAPSSGDLIITSIEKWDLAKEGYEIIVGENRGGHGGLRKDQMLVPTIISSISNKQKLKTNHIIHQARSEDVGATLLHLVGVYEEEKELDRNNGTFIGNLKFANPNLIRGKILPVEENSN